MNQQEIYQLCIEYGACVEAYIRVCIEDFRNKCGPDDCLAASMIELEGKLIAAGVEIDWKERAKEIRKRFDAEKND